MKAYFYLEKKGIIFIHLSAYRWSDITDLSYDKNKMLYNLNFRFMFTILNLTLSVCHSKQAVRSIID